MDSLEKLFEKAREETKRIKPLPGHEDRFRYKFEAKRTKSQNMRKWWYVAASVLLIFGWASFFKPMDTKADLADVSPEMQSTEQFFCQTINTELDRLKEMSSDTSTQKLIEDALQQIEILETEYEKLREELKLSGYDQRVIYAMINNFQQRIDLLQEVLNEIENINKLKNNTYDTV